jgi:hypothetical protein
VAAIAGRRQRQGLRQLGDGRPDRPPQQGRTEKWRITGLGEQLGGLLARIGDGTISTNIARKVFDALWSGEGSSADEIIASQGLQQITDSGSLDTLIDELLAANPTMVAEFRAGKEKAFNALVGQVMKATRGKANPQRVSELLRKKTRLSEQRGLLLRRHGIRAARRPLRELDEATQILVVLQAIVSRSFFFDSITDSCALIS